MMIKRISLMAMLVSFTMLVQAQSSSASLVAGKTTDTWKLLGIRTVDFSLDREVIYLKESGEQFQTLKFNVKNGTLNMHKCTVEFADGDTRKIELSAEMNRSNDGRIFDMRGSNRKIEKVTFWYDNKNDSNNKSIVELWGKG